MALVSPGEEVIIPAPYWTSYPDMVRLCNGNPLIVPTSAKENYNLSPASLRATLEAHPKATCIILCNPSNPSGCVTSKQELEGIASVLKDFPGVAVISDEIYEHLVYDVEHVSMAAIPGMYRI